MVDRFLFAFLLDITQVDAQDAQKEKHGSEQEQEDHGSKIKSQGALSHDKIICRNDSVRTGQQKTECRQIKAQLERFVRKIRDGDNGQIQQRLEIIFAGSGITLAWNVFQ